MFKIWFVEDYLSGEVIDSRFYSEHQEAVDRRNELGYGVVKSYSFGSKGQIYIDHGSSRVRVFPDEAEDRQDDDRG